MNGVIAFDAVHSSEDRASQERLRLTLNEGFNALQSASPAGQPVASSINNDGGVVWFWEVGVAYPALVEMVRVWSKGIPQSRPSRIVQGVRVAVHAEPYDPKAHYDRSGPGTTTVLELLSGAPVDSVRFSEAAFTALKDDLPVSRATAARHREGSGPFFDIPVIALLTKEQGLVQLASPEELIVFLASRPDQLLSVGARKFEEVCAELLSDLGYKVTLTKQTHDHGIDLIAFSRVSRLGLEERYLVQCKRYSPSHKVGVSVIHELLGAGAVEPHTGLILATTSSFTKPARDVALRDPVRYRLHLRDYRDLTAWIGNYAAKRR